MLDTYRALIHQSLAFGKILALLEGIDRDQHRSNVSKNPVTIKAFFEVGNNGFIGDLLQQGEIIDTCSFVVRILPSGVRL